MAMFVFLGPTSLLPMLAMAMARVRDYHVAFFMSSLLALSITIYLVGSEGMGAIGVALSLLVATGLAELFYFWPLQIRLTGAAWRAFMTAVVFRGMLPAVVASSVWAMIGELAPPGSWPTLVVAVGAGSVAYVVTLVSFCLDENDRSIVRRMISRVLG